MKKISYLLLLFFSAIVCGCSEYEQPYVGYIVVERAVLDAAANSSFTVLALINNHLIVSVLRGATN